MMTTDKRAKATAVTDVRVRSATLTFTPKRAGALGLLGVLLLGPTLLSSIEGSGSPARSEVEVAVVRGLDAIYSVSVVTPGARAADITDPTVVAHIGRVPDALRPAFTGKAHARMTDSIAAALTDQVKAGVRDVGGGTREVEMLHVDVRAKDADVIARALVWLRTDPVNSESEFKSVTSEGWWLYDFHLVATQEGWRIDSWSAVPD